ncbi:MAG TPA: PEP-CTERM sorting domain-containing protein [Cellvibrio sp.]
MKKTHSLLLSTMFALGIGSSAAQAAVITFDDLPATDADAIHNGYHSFHWGDDFMTSVAYIHKDTMPGTGFANGVVSGDYAAFNNFATTSTISSNDLFDFNGANLTAAWNEGLLIEVTGFLNNLALFTQTVTVSTQYAQWFDFNFIGINQLSFRSWGGTPGNPDEGGEHFVMDNFTYNESTSTSVPESSSLALLLLGAAGILLGRKTKKS